MEHSDSWDRPMPLAAPVLAGTETGAPVAYYDGIRAIARIAGQFSRTAWNAVTPCPEWHAADLAGHLRCVAARQNAAELAALPEDPPEEHIAAFVRSATRYAARIGPLLRLPHHSYRGRVVSVAGMAGAACVEWHVHAWDLACALGVSYRPADPRAVLAAWLAGVPQLPLSPDRDPWLAVLRSSRRLPD